MQAAQSGFGPGKVILLGEHAVVYGQPALAGPLQWGVTARFAPARKTSLEVPAELEAGASRLLKRAFLRAAELCGQPAVRVSLQSDLPVSVGLGSSAAVGVACARALLLAAGKDASPRQVAQIALEMEKEFHGTPSGVDHTTSAMGELILYRRKAGAVLGQARVVKSPRPVQVVIALAGQRRSTKETVAGLRERAALWPDRYRRLFAEIGKVAVEGSASVEAGDLAALGDAMNVNHGLLCALQLSSPSIDALVHRLRELGALGAKLTGAGGDGGAVIGLFEDPRPVAARLRKAGLVCLHSQLAGPEGQ